MPGKIGPGDAREMARMYEAGASLTTIGDRFGVAFQTVSERLEKLGVRTRPSGTTRPVGPATLARMKSLWDGGLSARRIGKEVGYTGDVVRKHLRAAGVDVERRYDRCSLRGPDLTALPPFGRLTVVARAEPRNGQGYWRCDCECGNTVEVVTRDLTGGHRTSCGRCKGPNRYASQAVFEGAANHRSEWRIWNGMRHRCQNPNLPNWKNYGGRGIRVCRRWEGSFADFLADVGSRPSSKHSLDRIDNDAGYTCGHCEECDASGWAANCRWATRAEQAANTRNAMKITFRGKTQTAAGWGRELGLCHRLISRRLSDGWDVERALTCRKGFRGSSSRAMTPLQRVRAIWRSMIHRCHSPKSAAFADYGGRGILVCDEWRQSFEAFVAAVGVRPDPSLSLDRIDNNRGYEPGNVRWATRRIQARNQRPRHHPRYVVPRVMSDTFTG